VTLRVAFAGTPDFALPAFHALVGSRHTLVGVLTQPDRPKGRGRQLAASPVKLAAQNAGIPVSQPVTLKTEADRADLAAWQPDVLVVVAYGLILPPAALDLPRLGCLNIHASLLPRWRGAAPIQRAILAGDARSGASIMRMEAGLDTGPVFLERPVDIRPRETGGSLHDRLAAEGAAAVLQVIDGLATDSARSTPQREDGITYASKIDKSEALIDWSRAAAQIDRQVRAFNPWPIAETRLDGEQLRIYSAELTDDNHEGIVWESVPNSGDPIQSGSIVDIRSDSIVVACGQGLLALTELQRPGRRPVAARDLINTLNLAGRRLG
jgi:methionyl-tRNA formyltransferase